MVRRHFLKALLGPESRGSRHVGEICGSSECSISNSRREREFDALKFLLGRVLNELYTAMVADAQGSLLHGSNILGQINFRSYPVVGLDKRPHIQQLYME